MLWPVRGMTSRAAVGAARLRKKLPSRHGSSSSPTITSSGGGKHFRSASLFPKGRRLSCTPQIGFERPTAQSSLSKCAKLDQPPGSLFFFALPLRPPAVFSPPPLL